MFDTIVLTHITNIEIWQPYLIKDVISIITTKTEKNSFFVLNFEDGTTATFSGTEWTMTFR